ncbi:MAG: hypothetical protein ABJB86_06900, partial [Bacteroidota bacterium]
MNSSFITSTLLLLLLLHAIASCEHGAGPNKVLISHKDSVVSPAATSINASTPIQVYTLDSAAVKVFFKQYPALLSLKAAVVSIYQKRKYTYFWYSESGLTPQANSLYN